MWPPVCCRPCAASAVAHHVIGFGLLCYAVLRCLLQLYVVKLNRKPLFPGIYTPVTITNNAGLIKEISDKKRSG